MRALYRVIVTGLILVTLVWLKGQIQRLHHSLLELDRLSKNGGILSSDAFQASRLPANESVPAKEDPLTAVLHAISDSLLTDNIDELATPKSALKDTRDKTVVVAKIKGENTEWMVPMLPKYVGSCSDRSKTADKGD